MQNIHDLALALQCALRQKACDNDHQATCERVGHGVLEEERGSQQRSEHDAERYGAHGSGGLCFGQFRPLGAEAFGKEVLPRDFARRLALYGHGEFRRGLAVAVGNVLEVPARGAAPAGKTLALFRVELEEVRFEVHGQELHHSVLLLSTSFDVHQTVKCGHGR